MVVIKCSKLRFGQDLDGVPGPFQFGASFLEAADDCHEFFVVDLIVTLRG